MSIPFKNSQSSKFDFPIIYIWLEMADLDDALVNYLTDKYSADAENGENDAEMDDIPDR